MADNVLSKISHSVKADSSEEEIVKEVSCVLQNIDNVYSYLIYAKYKNNELTNWVIEYNLSQNDKYNTLDSKEITKDIVSTLIGSKNVVKSVISYKQPSLELMIELYKPLIKKLALEQCEHWKELEYEDAVSMCCYTMTKLYKKGYYIHKSLLKRSFQNYVLMELRHSRNKPEISSFEKIAYYEGNGNALTLGDMIPDTEAELAAERKEDDEVFQLIFSEVKQMIIEFIGERQFEQLLRDYGNKHTTSWSRKKMQQIKERFKKLGITWKYFEEDL